MKYIAVFKDRTLVEFNTLDEVKQLPYVECIFKREVHEEIPNTTFSGQPIIHYRYLYTPINFDGTKRILIKGQFELIDIGPDNRYYKTFKGRELKIYDHSKDSLRQITSMTEYKDFIVKDLLPMLDTLELTNSWDIYIQLEEAKQMKVKIEKQIVEIDSLKSKIKSLEKQVNSLTAIKANN